MGNDQSSPQDPLATAIEGGAAADAGPHGNTGNGEEKMGRNSVGEPVKVLTEPAGVPDLQARKSIFENVKKVKSYTCPGHTKTIPEIAFSPITPDGVFLASASQDRTAMYRDGNTGDWIGTFEGCKGGCWSVSVNSAGTLVAAGSADFSANLWDATTGAHIHEWGHQAPVKVVRIGDSHNVLTCAGQKIRLYDLNRPNAAYLVSRKLPTTIRTARIVPHTADQLMWTASLEDPFLRVWDARTGAFTEQARVELPGGCTDLDLTPSGDCVAVACRGDRSGGSVLIYDLVSGPSFPREQLRVEVPTATQLTSATLHPMALKAIRAGKAGDVPEDLRSACTLAVTEAGSAKDAHAVHVMSFIDPRNPVASSFVGHNLPLTTVRFHPGGTSIATASDDCTIRLWPLGSE